MKLDEKFISYSCVAIRRPVYIFVVIESTADVVVLNNARHVLPIVIPRSSFISRSTRSRYNNNNNNTTHATATGCTRYISTTNIAKYTIYTAYKKKTTTVESFHLVWCYR